MRKRERERCPGLVAPWHVGSFWTRNRTCSSCIGRWILYHWTTREALERNLTSSNKIKIHMLLNSNPNVKILPYRNKYSKKKIAKWWPIHGHRRDIWYLHSVLVTRLCNILPKFSGLKQYFNFAHKPVLCEEFSRDCSSLLHFKN